MLTSDRGMKFRGCTITSGNAPIYWTKDDDTVVTVYLPNGIDGHLRAKLVDIFKDSWATVNIR